MTGPRRIYLAGPEVFLADPVACGQAKKEICAEHGFVGVFPLDSGLELSGVPPAEAAARIAAANEDLMRGCDLLIANMTPFRGPGMDGGTAYEMGFMRALGRPVLGYTTRRGDYASRVRSGGASRVRSGVAGGTRERAGGGEEDADGLLIEDYGLTDNLMMAVAVATSGGTVAEGTGGIDGLDSLDGFRDCVMQARSLFHGGA